MTFKPVDPKDRRAPDDKIIKMLKLLDDRPNNPSSLKDRFLIDESIRPGGSSRRVVYTESPIDLFGSESREASRGIGKNEKGFRVYWTSEQSFQVVENHTVDRFDRFTLKVNHNRDREMEHRFAELARTTRDRRIADFKAKLVAEVKANPDSDASTFIREHATEIGLQL